MNYVHCLEMKKKNKKKNTKRKKPYKNIETSNQKCNFCSSNS